MFVVLSPVHMSSNRPIAFWVLIVGGGGGLFEPCKKRTTDRSKNLGEEEEFGIFAMSPFPTGALFHKK